MRESKKVKRFFNPNPILPSRVEFPKKPLKGNFKGFFIFIKKHFLQATDNKIRGMVYEKIFFFSFVFIHFFNIKLFLRKVHCL
ncbi:MAG: hypothetical protein A2048_05055 [Deltaproteobacteria bacterium GWA2_45_12]|nr:MAG: hypothetical protein A2048_05055 [Deltaproteobacteria bacterium GWA2_45_12]